MIRSKECGGVHPVTLSDEEAHIVHRGERCFAIMNAFPYTSGHLMVLPYREVADLEAVVELAHRLLLANRGRWTQATTGSLRRGEESYVYGRGGAPCRRCGTTIKRDTLGERITFWCPACPPARSTREATTPV